MTLQDAFDKIYVGALTQMKCARTGLAGTCALLDDDGKSRCFIGMCLTPEQLIKAVEHSNQRGFEPYMYLTQAGLETDIDMTTLAKFIGEMLAIHDTVPVERWRERLEVLAKELNLRIPAMPQPGQPPSGGAAGVQVPQGA